MKLSAWVKHFIIYGLGVILMNLLPALMIPIYTYRVPPSVFGVLELLNRSQEILLLIISCGLRSSLLTFYQMAKEDPERQKAVYSTALQFLSIFGLIMVLLAMPEAGFLSQMLFNTSSYRGAILLILVTTYAEMLFQMAVLYLQSELRSTIYVSVFSSRAVLAIVLNLIFVYWWRWGLLGILWATLIHTALYAIGMCAYVFRRTGFLFDRKTLNEMLRFGAPVMIGAFGSFVLNNGDRYFINHYDTQAAVGLYGLGYRIGGMSMLLVLMPFGKIWSVTMVDISKNPDGPSELGRVATYLILACTFSTLGFSLLGPYLVRFLAERSYWEAFRVIPLVGAAYIFYAWTTIVDASFYVTKQTVYKIYTIFIGALVVMALYWWLIPRYGIMGAAWATLGGYISFAAASLVFAQRVYRIHYEPRRLSLLLGSGLLLYMLGNLIPVTPLAAGIVLRSLITLSWPLLLWFGGFFTTDERQSVTQYLSGAYSQLSARLGLSVS